MTTDKFNPNQYVISLKGKAYLPALPRIMWFRSECPNYGIKTEIAEFDKENGFVLFKATITNEKGEIVSQAYKSQRKTQFLDYIEKAETGAISRAVAFLGYGTLMAADIEEDGSVNEDDFHEKVYGSTKPM